MADRYPRRLTAVPPEPSPATALDELQAVVDEYLVPAALELQRATGTGDVDAVRAYGFELLTLTGTVIAACPRPHRRDPLSDTRTRHGAVTSEKRASAAARSSKSSLLRNRPAPPVQLAHGEQ